MADLSRIQLNKQGNAGQVKPKSGSTTKAVDKKPVTVNFSSTKGSTFSAPLKNSTLTSSLETTGSSSKDVAVFAEDTKAGAGAKTDDYDYERRHTINARYGNIEAKLQSALKGDRVTAGISDRFCAGQNTASATNLSEAQSYIGQATSYKREADQCMANGDYDGAIAAYKKAENSLKQAQRQLAGKTDKDSTALQQQTSILRSQYAASREKLQERKQMRAISSGTGIVCSGNCSSGSSFSLSDLNGLLGSVNSLAKTLSGGSAGSGSGVASGSGFKLGSSSSSKTTPSGSFFGGLKAALTGSSNTLKVDSKYANLAGVKAAQKEFNDAVVEQRMNTNKLPKLKQELSGLESKKTDLEKKINGIDDNLSAYKTAAQTITKKENELLSKQKDQKEYQAKADAQGKLVTHNQGKLNELAPKIQAASQKVSAAETKVSTAKAAYEQHAAKKPQAPADNATDAQKTQYQTDLKNYETELKRLKGAWEAAEKELTEEKAKLAELLKQKENYTKAMTEAQGEQTKAQEKADAYKTDIEKLETEIKDAKATLAPGADGKYANKEQEQIAGWVTELQKVNDDIVQKTYEIELAEEMAEAAETKKETAQENADIAVEAAEDPADFVEDNGKSIDAQMGAYNYQQYRKTQRDLAHLGFSALMTPEQKGYLYSTYGLENMRAGHNIGEFTPEQIDDALRTPIERLSTSPQEPAKPSTFMDFKPKKWVKFGGTSAS